MIKLTPAERAYQTKLDALCRELVGKLSALPVDADPAAVVALLSCVPRNTDARRRMLGDAFLTLDERPHRFGDGSHCQQWHGKLRQARNSPAHGPAMFALWRA